MVKHVSGAYRKLTLICHLANEPLESGCQAVYGIKNNILWFQKKIQNKKKVDSWTFYKIVYVQCSCSSLIELLACIHLDIFIDFYINDIFAII